LEQVESLHAAWRGEALRKPFQPDERQKQIFAGAAIWQRYPGTRQLRAQI